MNGYVKVLAEQQLTNTLGCLRRQILQRLEEGGISQAAFGRAVGHSSQWVTMVLRGQRGVRLDDIDRIAAYFGVLPTALLDDPDLASTLHPVAKGAHRAAKSDSRLSSAANRRIAQHQALIAKQQQLIEKQQRVIDDALSYLNPLTRSLESLTTLQHPRLSDGGRLERAGGARARRPRRT